MSGNFTKKFNDTEYKKHREKVLFDRETALLPETQVYAEQQKRIQDLTSELAEVSQVRGDLRVAASRVQAGLSFINPLDGVFDEKLAEYRRALNCVKSMDTEFETLTLKLDKLKMLDAKHLAKEKRQFTRKCPADGCTGFLSAQWKCGMCDKYSCHQCFEFIGEHKAKETHTCKPELLESAKLIAKETRPCPSCSALIYKISGCDQMYCTQCNTPFSWKTGQVEKGVIHNPHYFEYMRRTRGEVPRQPGDIAGGCEQHVDWYRLYHRMTQHMVSQRDKFELVQNTFHRLPHIRQVDLPKYVRDPVEINRKIRIKYLLKEHDEKEFKRQLQIKEKKLDKFREIHAIIEMACQTLNDIGLRFMANPSNTQYDSMTLEIINLRVYCNDQFQRISDLYKSVSMFFDATWHLDSNSDARKKARERQAELARPAHWRF
jgi:hypothetical protein